MRSDYLFTSESVSEGHPDKVADQISDAIVDLFLTKDPEARIACEIRQIGRIARVGQLVEVDEPCRNGVVFGETLTDEVGADETAAAGDEDIHEKGQPPYLCKL